jgi:two-component system response regulator NreC
MNSTITVLIVDDHGVFRTGLKTLLAGVPRIQVLGEAVNGREMVEKALQLLPDVIITDVDMPVMTGIEATKELCKKIPYCRVLVLSVDAKEETVLKMIEAGAMGYILKNAEPDEIRDAIYMVNLYKPFFCKLITQMLTEIVSRHLKFPPRPEVVFSEREKEIIKLICDEYTSKAIAFTLNLSKRTIEGHRTRIMDKISAKSVAGVIAYAFEKGIYKKATP